MIAKPTRKIPYAESTPKAVDPTVAHTNIATFNASAIYFCLYTRILNIGSSFVPRSRKCSRSTARLTAIVASNRCGTVALTLDSIDN